MRLHVTLKLPICTVVGACVMLWSIGDEQTTDGRLSGYTFDVLDNMVGVPGLCKAMAEKDVDWARQESWGVLLARFGNHNGESAKKRAQTARRASKFRNAPSVTENGKTSRSRNAVGVTKSAPRAEQRAEGREEKEKEKAMSNGRDPERRTEPPPLPTAALPEIHAAQGTAHCQGKAGDAVAGTPSAAARTDGNARVRSFTPRLMSLQHGGVVLYDQGAATAIAKALCGRRDISPETQYAWAVETMGERLKTEDVKSVPAYFRDLLLNQKPPPEWVHEYQRKQAKSL